MEANLFNGPIAVVRTGREISPPMVQNQDPIPAVAPERAIGHRTDRLRILPLTL